MRYLNYYDLKEHHRNELDEFPIAYAFNEQQMKEALEKLGAEKSECVTVFGHGDIVKKEDAPKLIAMLKRHTKELQEAMQSDPEFAENAFLYEMDNHEYAINYSGDEDVLNCFGWDEDDVIKLGLAGAYVRAREWHMKRMRNNGII